MHKLSFNLLKGVFSVFIQIVKQNIHILAWEGSIPSTYHILFVSSKLRMVEKHGKQTLMTFMKIFFTNA